MITFLLSDTQGMDKKTFKWIIYGLAFTIFLIVAAVTAVYIPDISRSYERLQDSSTLLKSPYGNIEYSQGGSGPHVLVIHGSGGGFDQGKLIADNLLDPDFNWIAPSRFGYLRSTYQEGASWDDQAHAYAYLLDNLNIDKTAVVAMSHGGPSALLFAVLHPERVSSLTLISCGVASSSTQSQKAADTKGIILTKIYKYDFPYWAITRLFKTRFMDLIGANQNIVSELSTNQQKLIQQLIDFMNPASLRSDGVDFDNRATLPGDRITSIKAPTLIFHARDDTLQLYHNAQFAFSTIPNSTLISFDRGGHVLLAVEQTSIRNTIQKHILTNL